MLWGEFVLLSENEMNTDFWWFNDRLFFENQSYAFANAKFALVSISFQLSPSINKTVSSAKAIIFALVFNSNSSLTYIENSMGPKIVPCGIP